MFASLTLAAALLELGPNATAHFAFVAEPTRTKALAVAETGKQPLVESFELTDEKIAFTNYADCASAVAFAKLPRPHLLHSWKSQGVTVLKRLTCEASPNRFRREAGFLAFTDGADGIWLAEPVPPSHSNALAAARADWELVSELSALTSSAKTNANPAIAIDARRVQFFLASGSFDWENLDTLRWECEAWRQRLASLDGQCRWRKKAEVDNGGQFNSTLHPLSSTLYPLSSTYDFRRFALVYTSTNPLPAGATLPGGTLDFSLWIADGRGGHLPYRFHCDLEPMIAAGPRAPARGRSGFLYGTDERFRPYSIAYGARNSRVTVFPRLDDYGPDYPDPRPTFDFKPTTNGWQATLAISWLALYGKWPMIREGVADVWYASATYSGDAGDGKVEKRGGGGRQISFPKGCAKNFRRFCEAISTGELTEIYKEELRRSETAYATSFEERMYPFAVTAEPTFQRGDLAADKLFLERIVQPLLDRNENTWQAVWTDKQHKPTFNRLPDAAKMQAWKNLGKLLYLSHEVSRLRGQYLADRFAGRLPPPYVRRDLSRETPPDEPDPDYDETDIQLDDKEF